MTTRSLNLSSPFETAGIIVVGIAVVVIVVGTILFFHVGDSIIRQAQKSEEWFRKLFEDTVVATAVAGSDHRYIMVNKAFREMLGYPKPRE